jgi:hypothetical protein
MLKLSPSDMKAEDKLKAAVEWGLGLQRVPFTPGIDLPGTVRPSPICWDAAPEDLRHIAKVTKVYDLDSGTLVKAVGELVRDFATEAKKRISNGERFAPLPHPPQGCGIAYCIALVEEVPIRLMMSYSLRDQAFLVTCDAFAVPPNANPAQPADPAVDP